VALRRRAVTIEQPGPKALLEAIARHRVTMLATAPTAYKAMLPMVAEHDIASLRTAVSAGEHLPAATWHAWHDATGLRLVDGIGGTEMMHIFISAAGDDIRPGIDRQGGARLSRDRARPGLQPQPHGTGRLALKGPTGCRYLDDPRQTAYVQNGWNLTGDTYRLDEDGYFWYVARSDDMIVSSGYNIGAPEVENALYTHPAVAECAVVGVPCPERGQKVKAFVVAGSGHSPVRPSSRPCRIMSRRRSPRTNIRARSSSLPPFPRRRRQAPALRPQGRSPPWIMMRSRRSCTAIAARSIGSMQRCSARSSTPMPRSTWARFTAADATASSKRDGASWDRWRRRGTASRTS
jgi:acyl-coenzyme A synthetase/AMP-(fatty) acid ligase